MLVLMAVVGAVVGSFLNVVIDRVPAGESLVVPSSHCPACGRALRAVELVPVLSYVVLRGRCRTCGAPIPRRVLAVEVATAVLYAILWYTLQPASAEDVLWLAAAAVYTGVMVVLFVIDLEHRRVPNAIVVPALAVALGMAPVLAWLSPRYAYYGLAAMLAAPSAASPSTLALAGQVAGGVTAFGLFWLIWRLAPRGIGAGDVKLAGFAGLITGFPVALAAVWASFIIGGIAGAALLLAGRAGRKTAIPFAPFLIVTTFVTMVFGDELLAWYLGG